MAVKMRYRIEDDFIVDDDNRDLADVIIIPEDEYEEVRAELALRVNGWDTLVAFVRSVEQQECYCCDSGDTVNTCDACRARVALREAGECVGRGMAMGTRSMDNRIQDAEANKNKRAAERFLRCEQTWDRIENLMRWHSIIDKSLAKWATHPDAFEGDGESPSPDLVRRVHLYAAECQSKETPAPDKIITTFDGTIIWKWKASSNGKPSWVQAEFIEELNQEGPRPNVWLGVSVENQAAADERIPGMRIGRRLLVSGRRFPPVFLRFLGIFVS